MSTNRNFGIVFFIFFLIVSLYPLINSENIRIWALLISLIFLILGLFNSKILTPLNIMWFKFGIFLGKIISPIVIGIIFFLIVTPTGFLMRLFKNKFIGIKFDKKIKSYWIKKEKQLSSMKNQF